MSKKPNLHPDVIKEEEQKRKPSELVPMLYDDVIRENTHLKAMCHLHSEESKALRSQIDFLEDQIEELKQYIGKLIEDQHNNSQAW